MAEESFTTKEKITLLKKRTDESLPNVKRNDPFIKLPTIEEKNQVESIKQKSPFVEDLHILQLKPISEYAQFAQEASISTSDIEIISLKGLDESILDYGSQSLWEFEPNPSFEREVGKRTNANALDFSRKVNKKSLWKSFLEIAEEIKVESEKTLDLKSLTPYQATYLVYELIRRRMSFEYLILDPSAGYIEDIQSGKFQTSKPEILPLVVTNPKRFEKERKKLARKMDFSSADKTIKGGFGTCRHIAATASVCYELLKEKQESIMLNGTYLAYHDEQPGETKHHPVMDNHAYNVLVVTTPGTKESKKPNITVCVLDPTWALEDEEKDKGEYDYTWKRLSQVPSFIAEFGDELGLEKPHISATEIADKAVERIETYLENTDYETYSWRSLGFLELLPDYASLLTSSSHKEGKSVLKRIRERFKDYGRGKKTFLKEAMQLPVFSRNKKKKKVIAQEYIRGISTELEQIDFGSLETDIELQKIFNVLTDTIDLVVPRKKKTKKNIERLMASRGYVDLSTQYMRAVLESGKSPSKVTARAIVKLYEIGKRHSPRTIPESLYTKFQEATDT